MNRCRICLSSSIEMDISQLKSDADYTLETGVDLFNSCLNIKIEAEMDENTKLCTSCFEKVISFYEFKCLALKSDTYLKAHSEYEVKFSPPRTDDVKLEDTDLNGNGYLDTAPDSEVKDEASESDVFPDNESNDGYTIFAEPSKNENIAVPKSTKTKYNPGGVCDECGKTVKYLSEHREVHLPRESRKQYECHDCGKKVLSYVAMSNHYRTQHSGLKKKPAQTKFSKKRKECNICGKSVTYLQDHMEIHRPRQNRTYYECNDCEKKFLTYNGMKVHYKAKHPGLEKNVTAVHTKSTKTKYNPGGVCEECGKTVKYLAEHKEVHLSRENRRQYECNDCGKKVLSYVAMSNHYKTQHSGLKKKSVPVEVTRETHPYACDRCGRRFDAPHKVDSHMKSHTRPFQCEYCEKNYGTQNRLNIHREQNHVKIRKFCCPLCPKNYCVKDGLTAHLKTHTAERIHACPECGKCFKSPKYLKIHREFHTTKREYICTICVTKAFKTRNVLMAHMVVHQEKKHECTQCGAKFHRSFQLRRHENSVHAPGKPKERVAKTKQTKKGGAKPKKQAKIKNEPKEPLDEAWSEEYVNYIKENHLL